VDELFASGRELGQILEDVARLGVALLFQVALGRGRCRPAREKDLGYSSTSSRASAGLLAARLGAPARPRAVTTVKRSKIFPSSRRSQIPYLGADIGEHPAVKLGSWSQGSAARLATWNGRSLCPCNATWRVVGPEG